MSVGLLHLEERDRGRRTRVFIRKPFYPDGVAASLFMAAGQEIGIGKKVRPKALEKKIVGVRFRRISDSDEYEVVDFQPIKELTNDPASKPASAHD